MVTTDARPGYRARVFIDVQGPPANVNWTEVLVLGTSLRAQKLCNALLEQETRRLPKELRPRLERACALEPLPGVDVVDGTYLFSDEHPITGADIALLLPIWQSEQQPEDTFSAEGTTTHFNALANEAECRQVLDRVKASQERARNDAIEAAKSWLEDELHKAEKDVGIACESAADIEARCKKVRRRLDRSLCEIEQSSALRSCENDKKIVVLIQQRIEHPEQPDPKETARAECRSL